jgi:hypothetical protein
MWDALFDERTGLSFTIAAALASVLILGSESSGTREHILLSQIRDLSLPRLLRLAGLWWRYSNPTPESESELFYDWRYTANQFVLAPSPLRLTARICFLNWRPAVIVLIYHPLWREDGSVIYNCCWSSPAHSFSGPSPVELATIFYCLRFETSIFVTSYDSQGYGGGIRPRLHTGTPPPHEWTPFL